jgi:toxin ParE1/3/4
MLYSDEQWGTAQGNAYIEAINRALSTLSANPRIGRSQSGIASNLYAYRVRQHIIYYRLHADTVTVLRILHGKMDAALHIDES